MFGTDSYNNYGIKSTFVAIMLLFLPLFLQGQADAESFCIESKRITQNGMIVLGAWAAGNIATGAYGWSRYSGSQKYFHQMNLFWNTVNLAIAGYALYNNYSTDCAGVPFAEVLAKHHQTERILLINAFADIAYIGTGLTLRYVSPKFPARTDMLKGYGNSLMLQGGFLLLFDGIMYGIMSKASSAVTQNLNLSMSPEFPGIQFLLTF